GDADPPAAGSGRVRVGVATARPDTGAAFAPATVVSLSQGGQQARAARLAVEVRASFARRATQVQADALLAARSALLDDVTLVVHGLDTALIHGGTGLDSAEPDPGFRIVGLDLADVTVAPEPTDDTQTATVRYTGRVMVWPGGAGETPGRIVATEPLL